MEADSIDTEELDRLLERAGAVVGEHWRTQPRRPAFRRAPADVARRVREEPLPVEGASADAVLDRIRDDVVPWPMGVGHPRWWGFINSGSEPVSVAADLVAAGLDNPCLGTSQIATDVELVALRWIAELVGYPPSAEGILVSGGSVANLVGLAAAREAVAPGSREAGVAAGPPGPRVYLSAMAHGSVGAAVETLGWGRRSLVPVEVGERGRMRPDALDRAIRDDRAAGRAPLVVVATAGTVNTGAVDPIDEIADVAEEHGCWLHVDGAYGAFAASLPERAELFRGIERADSVAADPHKWLYCTLDVGAALVRDPGRLEAAFGATGRYLERSPDAYAEGAAWFVDRGPQMSRAFRALKVWAVIRRLGVEGLRARWRSDIEVAAEVRRLAGEHPRLESLVPSDLSVFCIRWLPGEGDPELFNRALLERIHRDGDAFVNSAVIGGRFALRGCVVNPRSTVADAKRFVERVVALAHELEEGGAGAGGDGVGDGPERDVEVCS